jgi:hypothetical protein
LSFVFPRAHRSSESISASIATSAFFAFSSIIVVQHWFDELHPAKPDSSVTAGVIGEDDLVRRQRHPEPVREEHERAADRFR